jgi:3-phosphoshikimate 1-carboxyvinyltransferase
VAHLRGKESNRLDTLAGELRKLGADVRVHEDGLEIHPVSLHGSDLSSHGDHRLAMSFALIALMVPGISIEDPGCVKKSFPKFWETFGGLTGAMPVMAD